MKSIVKIVPSKCISDENIMKLQNKSMAFPIDNVFSTKQFLYCQTTFKTMIVPLSYCCIYCKRHAFTFATVTRPGDNNQVEWVEHGSYLKPSHIVYIDDCTQNR